MLYDKLWTNETNEFNDTVSAKDRVQDIKLNQTKLKKNVTYTENEEVTTKLEASNDENVVIKPFMNAKFFYVGTTLSEVNGQRP